MGEMPKKMFVTSFLEKNLIFQNLMKAGTSIHIDLQGIEYPGVIESYGEDGLIVRVDSAFIGEVDGTVRVNFTFHNNYHYFDTTGQHIGEGRLSLLVPDRISKNILRRYERIDVHGTVFMKLKILVQSDTSGFKSSSILDERVIYREARSERPAVDRILTGIRHLVSEFAQVIQIKIFKQEQKLTLAEQLLKETKKIFLIYDSYSDNIREKRFAESDILTVCGAYDHMISSGDPRKAAESRLIDLLQLARNRKIFSECYVPLMLEGEVVGYIWLMNDVDYHRSIKPAFALRTQEYGSILVEALMKYDYFRLDSGDAHDIEVVNISAGGLLFRLDGPAIKRYIMLQTVLQMSIKFPERVVPARGIVYRIDGESSEYGVKFQEIDEADVRYINGIARKKVPL
jgi:hypothetical protein